MKRYAFLFIVVMLGFTACNNDDDLTQISFDNLPEAAQSFMETNFPSAIIVSIYQDQSDDVINFFVNMAEGNWVQFDDYGNWLVVSCWQTGVPSSVVPADIESWVQTNYPFNVIVKIYQGSFQYLVILNNGIELLFNDNYSIIDVKD